MKTITANLKLYLPNRYFWPVYLFLAPIILIMFSFITDQKNNQTLIVGSFMLFSCLAGFIATIMQIDFFNKPFSFCLPGHRQNVKKILLIIGIAASFFVTLVMVCFVLDDKWNLLIFSLFFANLFFFWLSVEVTFFVRGLFFIVLITALVSLVYSYPYQVLGELIINHPVLVICTGLLSSILIWRHLSPTELARRFCAIPMLLGLFDLYNKEKVEKYAQFKQAAQKGKLQKPIKPSIERFFLNGMKKHDFFSIGRYIWGSLYAYQFPISFFNPKFILFLTAFIFVFSYSPHEVRFGIFTAFLSIMVFIPIPVYSSMVISNGRKERFYGTLILGITISFCLIIPLVFASLLSQIAQRYMPNLAFSQMTLVYHALSFKFSFIPFFLVPVVLIFKLLFHKKLFLMLITIIIFYVSLIALLFAFVSFFKIEIYKATVMLLNPVSLVVFVIAIWTIFTAVLRHVCFKWSLI